jgi:hypothetical protein
MTHMSQFRITSKFNISLLGFIPIFMIILLILFSAVGQTPLSFTLSFAQEVSPGESPAGNKPPSEQVPSVAQQNKTTITAVPQIPQQVMLHRESNS